MRSTVGTKRQCRRRRGEDVGVGRITPGAARTGIKCLRVLILFLTDDHLASEGLALISSVGPPATVLAILNRRVQPPRSARWRAGGWIGWPFPGTPIEQTELIRGTFLPRLNHPLSADISTLLTILAVIGQLLRVVAALLPNIVPREEAGEFAEAVELGTLDGTAPVTGIAD